MAALTLSSHTGRSVHVDHCAPCRQIWFDALESVALDARGWIRLLRALQAGGEAPAQGMPAGGAPSCPSCQTPLKTVANQSRFGRFTALECPQRHGHLHGHAGVLAERGLVRLLQAPERKALQEERHRITCFNCGAPADGQGDHCAYCQSPLVVLDVPRLARSLQPRLVDQAQARAEPGRPMPWRCRGCGSSIDPVRHTECPQCGHLVVSLDLPDLGPLLDAAEAALDDASRAQAARREPAPAGRVRLAEGAYGPPRLDRRASDILEDLQRDRRHWAWSWDLGRLLLQVLRWIFSR